MTLARRVLLRGYTGAAAPSFTVPIASGAWTQGNYPHAIERSGVLYVGYITDAGDCCISSVAGTVATTFTLHASLGIDSHNAPALLIRQSDDRLIAIYSAHDGAHLYQRISTNPLDVSAWGAETDLAASLGSANYTYPSLCQLSASGTIHLFYRSATFSPNTAYLIWAESGDGGVTWILGTGGPALYVNAAEFSYWQVSSNSVDRMDIVTSDADAYGTGTPGQPASLYHFKGIDGVGWQKSDGTSLGASYPFTPADLSLVYDGSVAGSGSRPWDILYDGSALAVAHEIVPADPGHHHWKWSDYSGGAWSTHEVCDAGIPNVAVGNWSGGAALRRDDATRMYACQRTGSGAWELYEFVTGDGGTTFVRSALTVSSGSDDNVYPSGVVAGSASRVVWMRGPYAGTASYSTGIASTTL